MGMLLSLLLGFVPRDVGDAPNIAGTHRHMRVHLAK
jgi:hypothetical protein